MELVYFCDTKSIDLFVSKTLLFITTPFNIRLFPCNNLLHLAFHLVGITVGG